MPRRKIEPPKPGHVVKEFKIGNTVCRICDDCYRDKTKEEVDAIMERVEEIAYKHLYAQEMKKRANSG